MNAKCNTVECVHEWFQGIVNKSISAVGTQLGIRFGREKMIPFQKYLKKVKSFVFPTPWKW